MNIRKALPAALAALAALVAGVWVASVWYPPKPPPLQSGVLLPSPRPIAPFALTGEDGQPWGPEQLQGRWTLLFAGFTHCPDVCPTTLGLMKALGQRLQPAPALVFLSVDPERDTPQRLREYVGFFGAGIRGVTGPPGQLESLCASLGIAFVKVPGATDADYTMDHSAALVLINPTGQVAGYFPPPHKADTLAADLARILGSAA